MKKIIFGFVIIMLTIAPNIFIKSSTALELKMATFLPKDDINLTAWWTFVEEVNKQSKGELTIKFIGGPEAIPAFKQFEALRTGVVDLIFGCEAYYGGAVTGAAYTHLTRLSPMEERKSGYYDIRVDLLKKHNVFYLGRAEHGVWFHLFTNKSIKRPQEMAGQKIRTSATYEPFVKSLGAIPITLPGSEVYTALERGVVDGYAWSVLGNISMGWPEVCKFIIEPKIYSMNIEGLINLDTWNKIPKPMQKLMSDLMIENETKFTKVFEELGEKELKAMQTKGMKLIKFTPEDTKWYIELAYKAGWDEVLKKAPELGPKLKKLLSP
ncbi:MAG: TRAP transporter substrate-binding protein DctP [Thermodesulfobacteriota bacterium]